MKYHIPPLPFLKDFEIGGVTQTSCAVSFAGKTSLSCRLCRHAREKKTFSNGKGFLLPYNKKENLIWQ